MNVGRIFFRRHMIELSYVKWNETQCIIFHRTEKNVPTANICTIILLTGSTACYDREYHR